MATQPQTLTAERKELLEKRVLESLYHYLQTDCNYNHLQTSARNGANDLLAQAATDAISIADVHETANALYYFSEIIDILRPLAVITGQTIPTPADLSDEE